MGLGAGAAGGEREVDLAVVGVVAHYSGGNGGGVARLGPAADPDGAEQRVVIRFEPDESGGEARVTPVVGSGLDELRATNEAVLP